MSVTFEFRLTISTSFHDSPRSGAINLSCCSKNLAYYNAFHRLAMLDLARGDMTETNSYICSYKNTAATLCISVLEGYHPFTSSENSMVRCLILQAPITVSQGSFRSVHFAERFLLSFDAFHSEALPPTLSLAQTYIAS